MAKTNRIMKTNKFKQNPHVSVKNRIGRPNVVVKKGKIGDARQKIMQKKRKNLVDAREIISGTKIVDARNKLTKLREKTTTGSVKVIGSSILQKTDRNGKISLVTNKNRTSASTMNLKIQQQLGLVQPARNPPVRTMKKTKRPDLADALKRTLRNEYTTANVHPDMYHWYTGMSPLLAPVERRIPADITVQRGSLVEPTSGSWKTFSSMIRQHSYADLDAPMEEDDMPMAPIRPGMGRLSSNIHSRLDTAPSMRSNSHGILSQPKTKVVVPMGHRIVVSNLQPTVTQDDIRELFEDIGHLLVAKLVRPGTAEVIYKNLKDAQKAVDTYHNRQLDGQPMKCLLVNKRPINNPTAPAIKSHDSGLPAVTDSNKLIPDISTIHKVLFQRN